MINRRDNRIGGQQSGATRLSVIMPTFNRAHLIADSIASILPSIGQHDELLVVDDGSTDATPAVLAAFSDRVRYVRQDNRGKAAALNVGLAATTGEFVLICDDDDIMEPGGIDQLVDALARSGAGFAFGRHATFRERADGSHLITGQGYQPDFTTGSLFRHMLEDAFLMHNSTLVRRSCYDAVGPFDETMLRSVDYEMFLRLAGLARGVRVDAVVYKQRAHAGARGPRRERHSARAMVDTWIKYDRRIFSRVEALTSLETFENLFTAASPDLARRAALLQRACVMVRHSRGEDALKDLDAALLIAQDEALTSTEKLICQSILNGKYGFAALLHADALSALRTIATRNDNGDVAVGCMVKSVLWKLRSKQLRPTVQTLRLLHGLGWHRSTRLAMTATSTDPRQVAQDHDSCVRERIDLAVTA